MRGAKILTPRRRGIDWRVSLRPDPFSAVPSNGRKPGTETSPDIDVEEKLKEAFARGWSVIVWNDPVNLMDYVVYVFKTVLKMNEKDASRHMWEVHQNGKSVVARETREKSELIVHRLRGFGLNATMEQDMTCEQTRSRPVAPQLYRAGGRVPRQRARAAGAALPGGCRTICRPPCAPTGRARSTRGDARGNEDLKESQEVLAEARAELRSERLALAENWMRELRTGRGARPVAGRNLHRGAGRIRGDAQRSPDDAGPGDRHHRGRHGGRPRPRFRNEARRAAILEIDVLGHFILVMLGPQIYRP